MSLSTLSKIDRTSGVPQISVMFSSYQTSDDIPCEIMYFDSGSVVDTTLSTSGFDIDQSPGFTSNVNSPVEGSRPFVGSAGSSICANPGAAGDTINLGNGAINWDGTGQAYVIVPVISVEDPANPGSSFPQTITATLESGATVTGPSGSVTIPATDPAGTQYEIFIDLSTATLPFMIEAIDNIIFDFDIANSKVCLAGAYLVSNLMQAFGSLWTFKAKCLEDLQWNREQETTDKLCQGSVVGTSVTGDTLNITVDVKEISAMDLGHASGASPKAGDCIVPTDKEVEFTFNTATNMYEAKINTGAFPTLITVNGCDTLRNFTDDSGSASGDGVFSYDNTTGVITTKSSLVANSKAIVCCIEEKFVSFMSYEALKQGPKGALIVTYEGDKTKRTRIIERAQIGIANLTNLDPSGDTYQLSFTAEVTDGVLYKEVVEEI